VGRETKQEETMKNLLLNKLFLRMGLALLLFLSLTTSGFAAGDKVTVTFWKAPHSAKEAEIWKPIIAEFEQKHPDIKIEHVITPWDNWMEKYSTGFASDNPPDVSYMVDLWSAQFAFSGQFADLDAEGYSSQVKKGYPDLLWAIPHINGRQYGIPFAADPRLFFYNKEIFDKAKMKYPTDAWTWNDFYAMAKKLTTKDQFGFVLPSTYAGRGYLDYFTWLWNNGGEVLNEDMTESRLNSPEAVAALEFAVKMFRDGIVPPHGSYDNVSQEDFFMRGGAAMANMRGITIATIRNDFPKLKYGIVRPPKGKKGQYGLGSWGFYALAEKCDHKAQAWEWLKFITSKEMTAKYVGTVGMYPARTDTGLYAKDVERQTFLKNIPYAKNIFIHPKGEEIFQLWWTEMELAIIGTKTPLQASDDAAKAINQLLSE
jgi:multiple sugar transport system substrate-binding protein